MSCKLITTTLKYYFCLNDERLKTTVRTIYKNDVPVGKVVFCFESYLFVYVSEEKSMGNYYKKKWRTKPQ